MKAKVVIIDDEKFLINPYVRELEALGFNVVVITKIQNLKDVILGAKHPDAAFFIVDMVMESEPMYSREQTDNGKYTGLYVCRDLRQRYPITPIILWTAASIDEVQKQAKGRAEKIVNCRYARKVDMPPSSLSAELTYYLKKGKFRGGALRLLWRAFRVSASAVGLGADVKELSS